MRIFISDRAKEYKRILPGKGTFCKDKETEHILYMQRQNKGGTEMSTVIVAEFTTSLSLFAGRSRQKKKKEHQRLEHSCQPT